MTEPQSERAAERVQAALKATIEANLVRERALTDFVSNTPNVAYFSRGVIFSKSGNGTPFSRGVIFSKSGSHIERELVDPEQLEIVNQLPTLDEVEFQAFTERLLRLKQVKDQGFSAGPQ